MCDMHMSVGERKHGEGSVAVWWRNLRFGSDHNYKLYGSDCGLGFASRIRLPPERLYCVYDEMMKIYLVTSDK